MKVIGETVSHYKILQKLGEGGMGEVYLAEDTLLRRRVALKFLPTKLQADPAARRRFLREARSAAALDHPYVCHIHEILDSADRPFIAMEYVRGETLKKRLEQGPIPPEKVSAIALQVSEALKKAHRQEIVHRDLKPSNIMLADDGHAKVMDFGLAKKVAHPENIAATEVPTALTQSGAAPGTPLYMSPEQIRGLEADHRTDIFSLGVVLYEMLTGRHPFKRSHPADTTSAILNEEPAPVQDSKFFAPFSGILTRMLAKNPADRYASVDQLEEDLKSLLAKESGQQSKSSLIVLAGTAALLVLILGFLIWADWEPTIPPPLPGEWIQLTNFPDSVTSPALSPDGGMLAFIRGPGTFTSKGQIYVKMLSGGEAVQLTDDSEVKMGPVFSPDGSSIAYTVPWDTWQVPVLGGEPRLWLPNASGLTWISERDILFSEIKKGIHMAIATSTETRAMTRDVYVPDRETIMAHRSYLSPDKKWVLVVEMETGPIVWRPCRLAPFDGSSQGRLVGPTDARCTEAAWSPDGRWMYFTADTGTGFHLWRQRFPGGEPEQITFGPTEEEGIAVTSDGSIITAVGLRQGTVWVRDGTGTRQISGEGDSELSFWSKAFSPDGEKLYFLRRQTAGTTGQINELWAAEVTTGRLEKVLSGFDIDRYDLSNDGRIVFASREPDGTRAVWVASLNRRSAPRKLLSLQSLRGGVRFIEDEIYLQKEDDRHSLYRVDLQGNQHKIVADGVSDAGSVEGRWVPLIIVPSVENEIPFTVAFPLDGGLMVPICRASRTICEVRRGPSGKYLYLWFFAMGGAHVEHTYVLPVPSGQTLPDLPPGGFSSEEEVAAFPGVFTISPGGIVPGPSPDRYAFTRSVIHRDLYRIRLPN